jgi:hypothetical protein
MHARSVGLPNNCRRTADRARRPSYGIIAGGRSPHVCERGITKPNSVRTGKWRCSKPTILLISIQEQSPQWISGTPSHLLADRFGKPQALFDKVPKGRLLITPPEGKARGRAIVEIIREGTPAP